VGSYERAAEAYRHTVAATIALGAELTDADWATPTECPLWSVGDVYAHLAGGERWMAGGHRSVPPPEGFQDWVDLAVLARRVQPRAAVLEELREVYAERLAQLASPADPETPALFPWGRPTTLAGLLEVRAFDCWVHEQDIRRAVGRPGNLGSPAAQLTAEVILRSFPRIVARQAGAPPGSSVRLVTTGEVPLDVTIGVDAQGRGTAVPSPATAPTTELALTWEAYARLSGGRGHQEVRISGDQELGERVLAQLTVTP
jgi:uncharacterized protein (TIGR03083 family)